MPAAERMPTLKQKKPSKRSSRKLLFLLFLFFITLLFLLFFRSSISKIETIEISGNHFLTDATIGQAVRVQNGDSFFFTSSSAIEQRVRQLPIVKEVKVSKHFPGKISVAVTEYPQVAVEISTSGNLSVLFANGSTGALNGNANFSSVPVLTGWNEADPVKMKLCSILAKIPPEQLSDISEIRPDPSVSYPDKLKIFTRSHFEVTTTVSFLPGKLETLRTIAARNEPGFISLLDADTYLPFRRDNAKDNTNNSPTDTAGKNMN
ncbi:cell division protein FtsQ/DivIB [Ferviditalea candida]|uniref:Cell division protein DivIB n=1 Tax=Ferviditalea candida TaxID=3108399 RepID=A0ABU5ZH50_9BACL|nr:FtsQ-type POTRA domain-containing protein [Paenibacillaceae bacterium T2]